MDEAIDVVFLSVVDDVCVLDDLVLVVDFIQTKIYATLCCRCVVLDVGVGYRACHCFCISSLARPAVEG